MFTHVVMTRFNLATPGRESSIRNKPGWLDYRFELFERYCLPSIAAQTSPDFSWIIYFDEGTPAVFRERIEKLRSVFPFIPYFTGLFPSHGWRTSVLDVIAPKTPLLLTTRLDNDDAVACDFVERLHDHVRGHNETEGAYNFVNGLVCGETALYSHHHESNAFFSLLEPVGPEMRTAPSIRHMDLAQTARVFQIEDKPMWLQLVHETNVSNKIRGRRVSPDLAGNRFPPAVVADLKPVTDFNLHAENLFLRPLREARDALLRSRKRS